MADTKPVGSPAWDPESDPIQAWASLRRRARTDEERACVAAATRQADRVWIALHNGDLRPGTPISPIPARNAGWHRLALSGYEVLRESGAYGHLAQLRPWACAAAEPVLAAWLNSPAPTDHTQPATPADDQPTLTVAQWLGVDDPVNLINGDTQVGHLSTVLNAAQDTAVFGVPHHRVELVTGRHDPAGTVVRIVVDTPHGLSLASEPLELAVLVDPQTTGVDGLLAALGKVAEVATGLFAAHAHAVWDTPPPNPSFDRAASVAGRAFPELDLQQGAPPTLPAAPMPGPGPTATARGTTSDTDRTGRPR